MSLIEKIYCERMIAGGGDPQPRTIRFDVGKRMGRNGGAEKEWNPGEVMNR